MLDSKFPPLRCWLAACLLVSFTTGTAAHADPIAFYAPPPLQEGYAVFATRGIFDHAPDGPPPERANERTATLAVTAMVGVWNYLAVAVTGSFVDRRSDLSLPGGSVTRQVGGAGDLGLLASMRVWSRWQLSVAPFVGLELPTGADDESDSLGRYPQRFQVSTGAAAGVAGVIASWHRGELNVDASMSYLNRASANDFEAGSEFRSELSVRPCVIPWQTCRSARVRVRPAAEMRLSWQGADAGPLAPADSGGLTWVVAPGAVLVAGHHLAELSLEVPLAQPADRHTAVVVRLGYKVRLGLW